MKNMMKRINWSGASYKDWIGVSAAPVFWIASLICFVLGLSFKEGTGILIPGTTLDILVIFSIGLGFANTAIQIVGNDTSKEDLGLALWLMWGGSYMLGIGSNVNFLYSVIGLSSSVLQFLVCWGLGIMIEVAPERLLVKFLRAIGILRTEPAKNQPQSHPRDTSDYQQNQGQRREQSPIQDNKVSTRLPISAEDLPEFLKKLPRNQENPQKKSSGRDLRYHNQGE